MEAAFRERKKRTIADIEANVTFFFQTLARDSLSPAFGMRRGQRQVDHVVYALTEAIIFEAHARREFAKEISVGFRLANRIDRLLRDLQIVVAVGLLQFLVLEEGGRRQEQIGVGGG